MNIYQHQLFVKTRATQRGDMRCEAGAVEQEEQQTAQGLGLLVSL